MVESCLETSTDQGRVGGTPVVRPVVPTYRSPKPFRTALRAPTVYGHHNRIVDKHSVASI